MSGVAHLVAHGPGDDPFLTQSLQVHFVMVPPRGADHGPIENEDAFGPRTDWSQLWTEGSERRRKVVKPADTVWEQTPLGRLRALTSPRHTDVRNNGVDVMELEIPAGGRSGRRWHMADEVLYVRSGSGCSLHWEVEAEIDDRYDARIAKQPSRHEIKPGDTFYVPHDHVAHHFAHDGAPPRLISCQNRLFKLLGHDKVVCLEPASDEGVRSEAATVAH